MAQFDVYINTNKDTNDEIPYLLDIQNDILKSLNTRVVVPLVKNQKTITHLTPSFTIEDTEVVMLTMQLAGIPSSVLGDKICNLKEKRTEILNAIDFMISGF
ncbi:MAG: CcdB family protein [Arcobacteraceae bacterium]|jgi:toxin CcdB|nr:CcdB family protein [Arcobacteraceae bacterium]